MSDEGDTLKDEIKLLANFQGVVKNHIRHTVVRGHDCNHLTIQIEGGEPLLTVTPYLPEPIDHSHIELDKEQARVLYLWLKEYFNEV